MDLAKRFYMSFSWHLIGKILGILMMVAGSVLVVRLLGGEKYGSFTIVLSLVQIVILMIGLGHDVTINTYLPRFLSQGRKDHATELLRYILRKRSLLLLVTAFALFNGAPFVATWFEVAKLDLYIRISILIIGLDYFNTVFKN
ncbi:MAG: hypothetical protein U9N45_05845, partial [Gemmatimonadota bacterium]|nr:hypothetical protein [Gemmatimonadota bacterium]